MNLSNILLIIIKKKIVTLNMKKKYLTNRIVKQKTESIQSSKIMKKSLRKRMGKLIKGKSLFPKQKRKENQFILSKQMKSKSSWKKIIMGKRIMKVKN